MFNRGFEGRRLKSGMQYFWRSSGAVANLSDGGRLTMYLPDGPPVRITFPGANPKSAPAGEGLLQQQSFYYQGAYTDWLNSVHFTAVRYAAIYPGIDLILVTNSGRLELNFEIAPHGDPSLIRMRYEDATTSVSGEGDLEIRTPQVTILQHHPSAFQFHPSRRRQVPCKYLVSDQGEVRIHTGDYDRGSALLIDPVLVFSTYAGGSGFDSIYAVKTDLSGNIYVTGETGSGSLWNNTLPLRSNREAFIAKLNSSATQVLYTVYLGGNGNDSARSIALDSSGNAYIAGIANSTNFPVTAGSFATTSPALPSAFVAKLNSAGALQYSTYLGGVVSGSNIGIAVDSSGAVYVAGQTASTSFPVTSGAFQIAYQGGQSDCFVSKLNPAGTALVYSTFLGGSVLDTCAGIALDSSNNAYVAGTTYSSNFPLHAPVFSGLAGSATAFVAEINSSGTALIYSTYLGGTNVDQAFAIAVDPTGSAYVAGSTASIDFPVTAGALQTNIRGIYNAFVSKFSPGGSSLSYSTLLGGSNSDTANSIAIDPQGRAIVGGFTTSSDFPLVAPLQASYAGSFDAFASVLDPLGATLIFSSYFGGSGDDRAYGITVTQGALYLAGSTASGNFPTVAAMQPGLNVASDGFLLEALYLSPLLDITSTHSGNFFQGQSNAEYTLAVSNAGAGSTIGTVVVTETPPSGITLVSMAGSGWTCLPSGNSCSRNDSLPAGYSYPSIAVTVDVDTAATSPQLNQASVAGGDSMTGVTTDSTNIAAPIAALGGVFDVAMNKAATQSSTLVPGQTNATNAVDGNTDGNYGDGSLSHTNDDANAWWQVDLGASATIGSIVIWNRTDCCGNRLSDYWVFVSDTPFLSTDTPGTLQSRAHTWSSHQTVQPNPSATVIIPGAEGRYVRVQLTGTNYLSLAEVQVLGSVNLALNKTATQSSTLVPGQTNASNAVDGNTDGNYADGSLSHTNDDANAWWQVDLGESATINSISLWNRTDCCGTRLSDYWVFVSNTPFLATDTPATLQNRAGTWSSHQTVMPNPSVSIVIPGAEGRYVRVQLTGANYLSLAEVQVFGQ